LYDPRHPDAVADPYPALKRLREEEPVHRSEVLGGWVLTRYEDVRAVLADRRMSADRMTPFFEHLEAERRARLRALEAVVRPWAVFNDPPAHGRLRGAMSRTVTAAAVQEMAPRIGRLVEDLLARVRGTGSMDVIADFAYPLPASVVMLLLGVPLHDIDRVKSWSDELALFVGGSLGSADKHARAERAAAELRERFGELLAARRREPRDDVLSALADDQLSDDEIVATAVLLLFAGHETTTHLIGNGLVALLRRPRELQRLRAGEVDLETAVEELLRFDPPGGAMVRVAQTTVEVGGCRIGAGERVFAMINAANRDPAQFADPDRLDVGRRENRHLTFGVGPHFCVGATLARLEARIAFEALTKLHDLRLADDAALEWTDGLVLRGLRALPVTFAAVG
jgi:cytochrome P450